MVLPVRGVLLALHLALLGLVEVRTGDPSVALSPQHLPPPLLGPAPAAGAAGAPGAPAAHLAVVHCNTSKGQENQVLCFSSDKLLCTALSVLSKSSDLTIWYIW